MKIILALLVCLLTACQTTGGISQAERTRNEVAFKVELARVNAERREHKITRADWSRETHRLEKFYFGTTPTVDALLSYRTLLAEKVDKGEMTSAEGEYAFNQKRAELQAQDDASRRQAAAIMLMNMPKYQPTILQPYVMPTNPTVNCASNRIGGTVYTNCN